jgi:hypothetical protein
MNKLKITEGDVLNAVIELLSIYEKQGKLYFWRNNNIGVYDNKKKIFRKIPKGFKYGISDIIILMPNKRIIFMEIKKPGGRQSRHQELFQSIVELFGFEYYLIYNVNKIIKILN